MPSALLASYGGAFLGGLAPTAAPIAAAVVFGHLAHAEWLSWKLGELTSPLTKLAIDGLAWRLAVPMTLNNLAGGVAGGVGGVKPVPAFLLGFLASFAAMALGHELGKRVRILVV